MKYYPAIWALFHDYFINHEIRIPFLNNQYFMESKSVFFVAQVYPPARRNPTSYSRVIRPQLAIYKAVYTGYYNHLQPHL